MNKFLIITIGLAILFLNGCQKSTNTDQIFFEEPIIIENFEDCLNAGFPIMESYPRQCNDGLNTYTEEILDSDEILEEDISNEIEDNEILENSDEILDDEKVESSTNTLQEKLKAVIERRNQESEEKEEQTTESTITSGDEQINEDDIDKLEKIIDEIISQ